MGNLLPFAGVSYETTCQSEPNCDYEDGRREVLKYVQHRLRKHDPNKIKIIEKYLEAKDGRLIFTKCYFPIFTKPKAVVFYISGYATNIDRPAAHDQCLRFAENGYIAIAHDHLGYGRSDGLWLYIPNSFDIDYVDNANFIHNYCKNLYVRDELNHNKLSSSGVPMYSFSDPNVLTRGENGNQNGLKNGKDFKSMAEPQALVPWTKEDLSDIDSGNKYFLCGRSMGGAVATRLAMKYPKDYKGMVLCCPMIEIDDQIKPSQWILNAFKWIANLPWFSTRYWSPNTDLRPFLCSTESGKRKCNTDTLLPCRPAPLKSGYEILTITETIQNNLELLETDYIILHGLADKITDPKVSQNLYERTKDRCDATIKLYEDQWHMMWWEPKGEEFHRDILNWLDEKSK